MDKAESLAREILKCKKCDGVGWFCGSELGKNGEPQQAQIQCDKCYQGEIASYTEELIPLITEALNQFAEEAVKDYKAHSSCECAKMNYEEMKQRPAETQEDCENCEHEGDSSTEYCGSCESGASSNFKKAGWLKDKEISSLKAQLEEAKDHLDEIRNYPRLQDSNKIQDLEQRLAEKEKEFNIVNDLCGKKHDIMVEREKKIQDLERDNQALKRQLKETLQLTVVDASLQSRLKESDETLTGQIQAKKFLEVRLKEAEEIILKACESMTGLKWHQKAVQFLNRKEGKSGKN